MPQVDAELMSPSVEALHAARTALTVAGGRVALAQRRLDRGDGIERVAVDLAVIPEHLALIASAVNNLARAAIACEGAVPLAYCPDPSPNP
ncbi:MAG: hypothetical protein IT336_07545 [Thermomicrobiales bacterium]|nr:hypothetical protein [Thermomicrobiales bacterium]